MSIILIVITCSVTLGLTSPGQALDMDLVGLLTKSLGVTTQQAQGGAGAIFNAASQNMSTDDFAKVENALPDIQSLMTAAPAMDVGSGALGGVSSMLSKGGGSVASMAGLAGAFTQLGLSSDMVTQFIPIILDYAQAKGGDGIASLLKTALQ
jgi:hypothetical protein